ncbi:MAG: hypothetical protein FWG81_01660 [Betaproteobacteria bacterium]|nr:hypothetical protein [Betaproteobacteria bacterium]
MERVLGWHCPKCGEIEFGMDSGDSALRVNAAIEAAGARARARRADLTLQSSEKILFQPNISDVRRASGISANAGDVSIQPVVFND